MSGNGDHASRPEWETLPSDPDSRRNLGYRITDWERFRTLDGSEQVMFLPTDEETLHDDAFVVADPAVLTDLGGKR